MGRLDEQLLGKKKFLYFFFDVAFIESGFCWCLAVGMVSHTIDREIMFHVGSNFNN